MLIFMKGFTIAQHQNNMHKHDTKLRKFVDQAIYLFAVLGPASTLPQVYTALIEQKIEGLSIITWVLWEIISCFWLLYGFLHKDKPIIIAQIGWIIVQTLVIIAIISF